MSSGQSPRGDATGALAGSFPSNVAIGLPLLMGLAWSDDFLADDNAPQYGEKNWSLTTTGTGTIATVGATDANAHEAGLRRLQVTASGDRAVLHLDTTLEPFTDVPVGTIFGIKIRHDSSIVGATIWAGFCETTSVPGSGVSNDFVGIRNEGANWFGVVRNDLVEATVDLGLAGSISTAAYRIAGFLRASDGYRFWTADATSREVSPTITHFAAIDTNKPNEDLSPVIGIQSSAVGAKGCVVDWFSIGGRTRRQ